MSQTAETGQTPAFPSVVSIDGNWVKEPDAPFKGLTKREYFAAMAMQGYVAHLGAQGIGAGQYTQECVDEAVTLADALLAALAEAQS